jgi:toluene monooxygenase system ferredoxin subunit
MSYRNVARRGDIWSGEMLSIEVSGQHLLLVNLDDQIYAYADICPHQKSRLSEGTLGEGIIRCARHHWEFDARSGAGVNPQNTCLRVFPVRLDGDDILVDIDTTSTPDAAGATEP